MKTRSGKINLKENPKQSLQGQTRKNKEKKNPVKHLKNPQHTKATVQVPQLDPNLPNKTQHLLKQLFENLDSKVSYTRALNRFIQENETYAKFKPQIIPTN